MKNKLIVLGILLFLFAPTVKAYDMSSWKDISQFTLPSGINKNDYYITIFQRTQDSQYRLIYMPKGNNYYFGGPTQGDTFPYTGNISTFQGPGSWYSNYWYDSTGPNDYSITNRSSSKGSTFTCYKIIYTNTDIWFTFYQDYGKFFDYNEAFPPYILPTFTNTIFVEDEKIRVGFEFTSWPDQRITKIITGPILTKEYTYHDYLESNKFSIITRFPSQNRLMPIEFYDNNTLVKRQQINIGEILDNMPEDEKNEVIAQEQYQENIYQWENGDYSSTIKNTLNDSNLTIGWVREMLEYIFGKFPVEVRYALISLFIVILIVCIIRMIWR